MSPRAIDLVGWRLPGGTSRVDPEEDLLLHDAVRAPRSAGPHPIWTFLAPQRGMGLSLPELFEALGTPLTDGPVLGSFGAQLHRELVLGAEHTVAGEVTAVTRRVSRVLGVLDEVTVVLDLRRDDTPVVTATYGFLLPRRDVVPPELPTGGRTPRREGSWDDAGEPITVRAQDMRVLAGLLRDTNPIHLDADASAALGFGRVLVNQGPANLAYALTHLVRSRPGALTSFDARFLATVLAGDTVRPVLGADGAFALLGADGRPAVVGHAVLGSVAAPL